MASKQFNSVDGYAVGNANVVIDSNGNVSGNLVTATANVTAPRFISNVATGTAPFVVTSTTQVANLNVATAGTATSATTAGTVTTNAQPNITSVGTLTGLTVSGNANVGNLNASVNITSNNLLMQGDGTDGYIRPTNSASRLFLGANNTNYLTITAAGAVNSVGNITAPRFVSNIATGTAPFVVTSTTQVANLNVAQAGVADSINVAAGTGNNFLIFANAATGNISELTSTGLTANLSNNSITATTFVGSLSGTATSATTAGTVTTAAQPNITSVGTLTSLAVSGTTGITSTDSSGAASTTKIINAINGTRDLSLIPRAGSGAYNSLVAADDAAIVFANSSAQGNANLTIAPWASATTGIRIQSVSNTATIFLNATTTNVSSALQVTNITTGANSTAGTVTGNWTLTAGSRWQATYADLAERYVADDTYEPGTVVVLGGEHEVTIENVADSHKVAGVITTNPAYIMNAELQGDNVVEVALIGRVPCKVVGPISKGDLLTSSEIAGYAHANNNATAGKIIGKSLENFSGEKGIIEIMVGKT